MEHRRIAKKYLKLWFWLDLVASFPYKWMSELVNSNENSNLFTLFRFFRFLKLIKILRVLRFKKIMKKISDYLQFD